MEQLPVEIEDGVEELLVDGEEVVIFPEDDFAEQDSKKGIFAAEILENVDGVPGEELGLGGRVAVTDVLEAPDAHRHHLGVVGKREEGQEVHQNPNYVEFAEDQLPRFNLVRGHSLTLKGAEGGHPVEHVGGGVVELLDLLFVLI